MLLLAADENFNNDIVRGLLRKKPNLDIVRVQDAGFRGAEDPVILEWAADEGRVVVTHDAATLTYYAYERVRAGLSMPGVAVADDTVQYLGAGVSPYPQTGAHNCRPGGE